MKYRFSYNPSVQDELVDAIKYFLEWHPSASPIDFLSLAVEAFVVPRDFPFAMPIREIPGSNVEYRRVKVWHFVFLYRIDKATKTLVVDRIYHELSKR